MCAIWLSYIDIQTNINICLLGTEPSSLVITIWPWAFVGFLGVRFDLGGELTLSKPR